MIGRRSFLGIGAQLGLALAACSRSDAKRAAAGDPPPVPTKLPEMPPPDAEALPRGQVGTQTWTFDNGGRAVVIVPSWTKPGEKLPVLIALHGRGEANKGPVEGVMGWPRDYALLRAIERVCSPPITERRPRGLRRPEAPHRHECGAQRESVQGPRRRVPVPARRRSPQGRAHEGLRTLPPRDGAARACAPSCRCRPRRRRRASTACRSAEPWRCAWASGTPRCSAPWAALQAALGDDQVTEFTELAKAARGKNPSLKLRLLTSKEDYFRGAIAHTSAAWKAAGIDHDYADVPGPHDYPFNRGPGAIEMLVWHDRMLAHA